MLKFENITFKMISELHVRDNFFPIFKGLGFYFPPIFKICKRSQPLKTQIERFFFIFTN